MKQDGSDQVVRTARASPTEEDTAQFLGLLDRFDRLKTRGAQSPIEVSPRLRTLDQNWYRHQQALYNQKKAVVQFLASQNLNHIGPGRLPHRRSAEALPLVLSSCQKPTAGSNNDTLNLDLSGLPTVEAPSRLDPTGVAGTFRTNNIKQVNF